ncbi:MAG TPA: hypothetical protein VJ987_04810 [Anaerolineales bacterium]|nr:hypothetical protein [Anaerolineales bacterium]
MTKDELRALKEKHRIELLMQEAGEAFEVDAKNSEIWRSTNTYGLTVDIRRQTYEINRPGMEQETGDVITWLKRRYSWTFGMVLKFLQKRKADPKRQVIPNNEKRTKLRINPTDEWKTIGHIYTDPKTGNQSYAISYKTDLMDDLQKHAFEIAGDWILDYLSKSSGEISNKINHFPQRFEKIVDFEITECAICGTSFNWSAAGTFAYAAEEAEYLEVVSDVEDLQGAYIEESIYIDSDFVICEKCLRSKYAPRYKALTLAYRSAVRRAEAWEDAERERERERDSGAAARAMEPL